MGITDTVASTDGLEVSTSTALRTDHYELTALQAALQSGVAGCDATFEAFARRLPKGRRYGVVAGVADLLAGIEAFRFTSTEIGWLADRGFLDDRTLTWLAAYRFDGDIDGYAEGELYFPHSPVLTVSATFGDALILETFILSKLNHGSAVASAAARMVTAANGTPLIEGGGRRTHDAAATAAARAAYIAGFAATSNLDAGRRHDIATAGTTMHAFTLAHRNERDAFDAQVAALGADSTFLVDTTGDIAAGIDNAIAACAAVGATPARIRIDSGDLRDGAEAARAQLDAAGAPRTQIVVSGDLDEYSIASLDGAPVDAMIVGTSLVVGSGAPTAEMVYKLVSIADVSDPRGVQRAVAKASTSKISVGGRKVATRLLDEDGYAYAEAVAPRAVTPRALSDGPFHRQLQIPLMRSGDTVADTSAATARTHHAQALAELRAGARDLADGRPALDATPGN